MPKQQSEKHYYAFGSLIPERSGEANCVPCGVLAQAIKSTYASTLDDTWTNSAYMTNITAEFTSRGFTLPSGIDDVADVLALCSLTAQNPESTGEVDMVWDDDADRKRTICPDGSLSFTNDYDQYNYRFGFNGQERDDDVAGKGNINTAQFWEYDTRTGRRWNIDPKPHASLSSYSAFANNPIINTDVNGDTTYFYDTQGYYLGTVFDKLSSNEIVFLNAAYYKGFMGAKAKGASDEAIATTGRSPRFATARITKNTTDQLAKLKIKLGENERGGLLWIDSKTKELNVWECTDCVGKGSSNNQFDIQWAYKYEGDKKIFLGASEVKGTIFMQVHSHDKMENPTIGWDYEPSNLVFNSDNQNKAAIIVAPESFIVYPFRGKTYGVPDYERQTGGKFSYTNKDGTKTQGMLGKFKYDRNTLKINMKYLLSISIIANVVLGIWLFINYKSIDNTFIEETINWEKYNTVKKYSLVNKDSTIQLYDYYVPDNKRFYSIYKIKDNIFFISYNDGTNSIDRIAKCDTVFFKDMYSQEPKWKLSGLDIHIAEDSTIAEISYFVSDNKIGKSYFYTKGVLDTIISR